MLCWLLQVADVADVVRQQANALAFLVHEHAGFHTDAVRTQTLKTLYLRLQVADVADVVRQQVDALMLCRETAVHDSAAVG